MMQIGLNAILRPVRFCMLLAATVLHPCSVAASRTGEGEGAGIAAGGAWKVLQYVAVSCACVSRHACDKSSVASLSWPCSALQQMVLMFVGLICCPIGRHVSCLMYILCRDVGKAVESTKEVLHGFAARSHVLCFSPTDWRQTALPNNLPAVALPLHLDFSAELYYAVLDAF